MDSNFVEWMQKVNQELEGACGLTADDLEDANYHDMFESGTTPDEAAAEVLSDNGYDG